MTITKHFKKLAIGLSLTAAMMGASTPALAENSFLKANLSQYNSATAEKWVQDGCQGQCTDKLVIVTYSSIDKDKAFARAGFNASKRLHDEGYPVFYVMASDNNDNVQDALMRPFVNGVKQDGIKLETKYGLLSQDTIERQGTEQAMYAKAKLAYNQYLQASNTSQEQPAITLASYEKKDDKLSLAMK